MKFNIGQIVKTIKENKSLGSGRQRMDDYGYHWKGVKLTNDIYAANLLLRYDNTESQVDDWQDVKDHKNDDGLFGIELSLVHKQNKGFMSDRQALGDGNDFYYGTFVVGEILRSRGSKKETDRLFDMAKELYRKFYYSNFNNTHKNEYDCIAEFIEYQDFITLLYI